MRFNFLFVAVVALVLSLNAVPVMAQMTDDAVISYVKQGLSNGKSQDDLIKELAVKGVTKSQVERIKKRLESSKGVSGGVQKNMEENRMRGVGNMADMKGGRTDPKAPKQFDYNTYGMESFYMPEDYMSFKEMEPLDSNMVFGRNVFANKELTFAPNENIATPENYRLGPGDEVIVDIWGANQNTIRQVIAPDGFINVEGLGLVFISGMTVKEADAYMRRQLNSIYSVDGDDAKSEIKLTLGTIRTIMVNVMGEVSVPGTYSLSSLSTVYHALYRAGGFSDLGSVRKIELVRNGKRISEIDVYDFIINGSPSEDVILQDGDVILVPTYEAIATVRGNVKRPVKYEMKQGETLADLIAFSGGFKGDAYTRNVNVVRRNGREMQVFTVMNPDFSSFQIMDGDSLTVGTVIDRYENRVEIKGAVYRPGIYELNDATASVLDLVNIADGIMGDAYLTRALIYRERPDLTQEIIAVDLKGVMDGTVENVVLAKNDILYIPSIHDIKDIGVVNISGEVAMPGVYDFAENMTIEDLIMQAGGLLESASVAKIDVSRRIKDDKGTTQDNKIGEMYTLSFKDGYVIDDEEPFILKPYDFVYVRRSPSYNVQSEVTINGEVSFPGVYTMTERTERLSDLINKAGGVNQWAYIKGARLSRKMNDEERARMEATLDVIESAKDSIDVDKLEIKARYYVGIDLQAALLKPGSDADLVLRAGDILEIPQYINTVKVTGNVMYPNTVTYLPEFMVNDYVAQAGGYGYRSKKNRAYIVYMNGTVARARRFSSAVVEPGCEIVIPSKREKGASLEKFLSIATTSSSIATMLATITNLVKP